MILGGSTNAVLHLIAIAHSVGINLTIDDFQSVSDRVPFIADLKPSGKYVMEDVYKIGGIPGSLLFSTVLPPFSGNFSSLLLETAFLIENRFLDLSAFVFVVPETVVSDLPNILSLIETEFIRGLCSGLALSAKEQANRREHSHRHREDAGGEPGTMGSSTWGTLDDDPGRHQTAGEANQVYWAPEVSLPFPGSLDNRRCHVRCWARVPSIVYGFSLFGSRGSDGRSFTSRTHDFRPIQLSDSSSLR